jgi:hypothetical protein
MMGGEDVANTTSTSSYLSIIATTTDRVKELPIKAGQLIFARDEKHGFHRIAFDRSDGRIFYNQITVLESEYERTTLSSPTVGYYFVIGSACLYKYQDETWEKLTKEPDEVVFIGVELPELGQESTLYVNKEEREISVWVEETGEYITVADYTKEITDLDIENLF